MTFEDSILLFRSPTKTQSCFVLTAPTKQTLDLMRQQGPIGINTCFSPSLLLSKVSHTFTYTLSVAFGISCSLTKPTLDAQSVLDP